MLLFALGLAAPTPARAAPPRILYASDWLGHMEVFAAPSTGKAPPAQLTSGTEPDCVDRLIACGFADPLPSPDGRWILYRGLGRLPSLWLAAANGSTARQLLPPGDLIHATGGLAGDPAWSRDSKLVAYSTGHDVHAVGIATGSDQIVAHGIAGDVGWARDGRSLFVLSGDLYRVRGGKLTKLLEKAGCDLSLSPDTNWAATSCPGRGQVTLARLTGSRRETRLVGAGIKTAWSPDGRRLAFHGPAGISVYDLRTRRTRVLSRDSDLSTFRDTYATDLGIAWAPDGRSIAYVQGAIGFERRYIRSGDLRVVTLAGRVRTLVSADKAYGGRIVGVSWTRPPTGTRYRPAQPAPAARLSPESVLADGPIDRLAGDGAHVAFSACQHVFTWTPTTGEVTGLAGQCFDQDRYSVYDVAVAGDRVAYTDQTGCNFIRQQVLVRPLASTSPGSVVAVGHGSCAGPFNPAVGSLVGSGSLLFFSNWQEQADFGVSPAKIWTTEQSFSRVEPGGCPCPVIASSPGPLIPADVDGGRVVVYGDNATLLLDKDGRSLLSVPIAPRAAQLSENNLVLATPGQLLDYDAGTGALLHTWALPNVETGRDCAFHCGPTPSCWYYCAAYRLVLEDAARGLVAYIFDGQLHVLRLVDGKDMVVAQARVARFIDSGLVYVDGSRISFVPFTALPLPRFG